MVDWTASMQQTFEFYEVNPNTWTDLNHITTIKKCSISRDAETDTLGSATFDVTDLVGECYIRVYLVTIQNGVTEKHPIGTFLVQTPSSSFDGKTRSVSMDAYTPLIELKEKQPPIGYFVAKGKDVMKEARALTAENMRGPVAGYDRINKVSYINEPSTILTKHFAASSDDTWMTFLSDLIATTTVPKFYEVLYDEESTKYYKTTSEIAYPYDKNVSEVFTVTGTDDEDMQIYSYEVEEVTRYFTIVSGSVVQYHFDLDEMGRTMFTPNQRVEAMTPVWTYTDDNSSILYPEVSLQHDLYGIPNVVNVVWSGVDSNKKTIYREGIAKNEDHDSPTSIEARGREIPYRVINPDIHGEPTEEALNEYAKRLLEELSTVEYTISYSHGYCPVRLFDCVRLNYERAGLKNIKAKVISQNIDCRPGCKVTETAVFTKKLWR